MRVAAVGIGGQSFDLGSDAVVADSILNRPYTMSKAGLPLTRAFGRVMGIPALEKADTQDNSKIMIRATNLANLTTRWLLKFKPEVRQSQLEAVVSISWTSQVLKFAANMPSDMSKEANSKDRVRFSLAMHFMLGIFDSARKADTDNAQAYIAFAAMFRAAEDELKGRERIDTLNGLGQFMDEGPGARRGPAAASFFAPAKQTIGQSQRDLAAQKAIQDAKAAQKDILTAAEDTLYKGMKSIFGEQVGGVLGWIIVTFLKFLLASVQVFIEIIKDAFDGVKEFLVKLSQGDLLGAMKALLQAVSRIIFMQFFPIVYPLFNIQPDQLRKMADKVSEKNPLFPISVILGVLGVIPFNPAGAITLTLALTPAFAVLLAPIVKPALDRVNAAFASATSGKANLSGALGALGLGTKGGTPADVVFARQSAEITILENGIEQFIKLVLVVIQGAMSLADILPRLRAQVTAYLKKKGGVGGVMQSFAGKVMDKLRESWGKLFNAITNLGKDGAATATTLQNAMQSLFDAVPQIIAALGEELGQEIPAFDEAIKAIKDAPKSIEEKQKMLEENSRKIYDELVPQRKETLIIEEAQKMGLTVSKKSAADPGKAFVWKPELSQTQQTIAKQVEYAPAVVDTSKTAAGLPTPVIIEKKGPSPVLVASLGIAGGLVLALALSRARA